MSTGPRSVVTDFTPSSVMAFNAQHAPVPDGHVPVPVTAAASAAVTPVADHKDLLIMSLQRQIENLTNMVADLSKRLGLPAPLHSAVSTADSLSSAQDSTDTREPDQRSLTSAAALLRDENAQRKKRKHRGSPQQSSKSACTAATVTSLASTDLTVFHAASTNSTVINNPTVPDDLMDTTVPRGPAATQAASASWHKPPPQPTPPPPPKAERIPPIVFAKDYVLNWAELRTEIQQRVTKPYEGKMGKGGFVVQLQCGADYRKITKYLQETQKEFHSFRLMEEKLLRVVLRGIPTSVTEDEIMAELTGQGFNPSQVIRLRAGKTREPLPLILVSLPKCEFSRSIYDLRSVCYIRIKVEAFRKAKGPGQCHNCQAYGHAQSHCHQRPKCVKCAGPHLTADCKKSRDTPAKCCNCGGSHPANYRGCSSYPRRPTDPPPTTKPSAKGVPRAPVTPGVSFAQAARGAQKAAVSAAAAQPSSPAGRATLPPPPLPTQLTTQNNTIVDILGLIAKLLAGLTNVPSQQAIIANQIPNV
jgi:hypothetical protein